MKFIKFYHYQTADKMIKKIIFQIAGKLIFRKHMYDMLSQRLKKIFNYLKRFVDLLIFDGSRYS